MSEPLILERIYEHELARRDTVFMSQPVGEGGVVDYTWGHVLDEARRMAAHLGTRGIQPGDRIALLAKNSAHFIIAELAIWMAGATTVAVFPTESAQNVRYVLEHSEARLLFIGKLDGFEQQRDGLSDRLPRIALPLAPAACLGPGVERWEDIVARTEPLPGRPSRGTDELAMLMYTSGSTGQPKGVMHSFGTVSRRTRIAAAAPELRLPEGVPLRMLSYLPLAHTYERAAVECFALFEGTVQIYFCDTLATFMEDLQRAQPTLFVSVPRLWFKFQQGVLAKLPQAQLDALLANPQTAAATRRNVLAAMGLAEVRLAVTGSAPVPPVLLDWYRRLGLNLIEGYAMTEDFAWSHYQTAACSEPGYVGVPSPGVEARLADDGEILIKSPGTMVGYFKRPDLNAECFTDDGFFRTGDLGEQRPDGQLRIVGRKKELFKTAKGKYIAPAPIENLLNAHPMVELSMVSGVGRAAPYAMLMLNEVLRPRLAERAVRAQVENELSVLLQEINQSLANHERLGMLVVTADPWSIENGCLTPTLKIKRSQIEAAVQPSIDTWYAMPGPVIWAATHRAD